MTAHSGYFGGWYFSNWYFGSWYFGGFADSPEPPPPSLELSRGGSPYRRNDGRSEKEIVRDDGVPFIYRVPLEINAVQRVAADMPVPVLVPIIFKIEEERMLTIEPDAAL